MVPPVLLTCVSLTDASFSLSLVPPAAFPITSSSLRLDACGSTHGRSSHTAPTLLPQDSSVPLGSPIRHRSFEESGTEELPRAQLPGGSQPDPNFRETTLGSSEARV